MVQGWVVDAGRGFAQHGQQRRSSLEGGSWDGGWGFRVRVEEVRGVGWGWVVGGRRVGEEEGEGERVKCALVGEGKGVVRVGAVVGVGGLGWRVELLDDREGGGTGEWWVGVGWEVG